MFKKKVLNFFRENATSFKKNLLSEVEKKMLIQKLTDNNHFSKESLIDNVNLEVIVSLTTFGKRIFEVFLTLESLSLQTVKPGMVILWLSEDEFQKNELPVTLLRLEKRGLTIRFTKDIKAYKKLIPAIREFSEKVIITVDDDVMYNFDLVETLLNCYRNNSNQIYCGLAKKIIMTKDGVEPYNEWNKNTEFSDVSPLNVAIGYAGVLYFPGCFHKDILNEDKFMSLSPYSDDLWFKAMSLLNNVNVQCVASKFSKASLFIPFEEAQQDSLSRINVLEKKNDIQFNNLNRHYDLKKHFL